MLSCGASVAACRGMWVEGVVYQWGWHITSGDGTCKSGGVVAHPLGAWLWSLVDLFDVQWTGWHLCWGVGETEWSLWSEPWQRMNNSARLVNLLELICKWATRSGRCHFESQLWVWCFRHSSRHSFLALHPGWWVPPCNINSIAGIVRCRGEETGKKSSIDQQQQVEFLCRPHYQT